MEAVKNIGEVQLKEMEERGEGLLQVFTDDVSGGGVYKNCLEVVIEVSETGARYKEIYITQYDSGNKEKYLYRSGSSRGADITPTAKLTDLEKTLPNKILKGISDALEFSKGKYAEEREILETAYIALKEDLPKAMQDIEEELKSIPKKEGCFLTLVVQEGSTKKYIGNFELFKDKIVSDAMKKFRYSETYKKDVYKEDAACSICTQKSDEVYGLVGIFPFYTIDKPGYISGGFQYEKAWRNYPVCRECAIKLELGKKYLDEKLVFPFYGRRYYLIPKPIYEESLEEVLKKYRTLKSDDVKETRERFSGVEERVFRLLGREENYLSFDLMFFEKNNAALNIHLNIEDAAPSRFRRIFNALDDIRRMDFFEEIPVGFELINIVFPREMYNRYFLDIIDKIISDRRLELKFLMKFFNEYIIEGFKFFEKDEFPKDRDNFERSTLRVFGFLYFLQYLNLFKERKEEKVMVIDKKAWDIKNYASKEEMFEDFFNASVPFFDTADRKAVFLAGYAAKKLLNVQYQKEKRKPFLPKLKGLKLSKRDIQRLVPDIQGKLQEYKSEFYNDELNLISQYMIASNGLEKLSDLDVPFYFSLGMNMDKNFITSNRDNADVSED